MTMQIRKKYLRLLGALVIASSAILLNSCAPTANKEVDPRFVGTWATRDGRETSVLGLSSTGRGKLFTRKKGKFLEANLTWSTRSNILEIRRTGIGAFIPGTITLGDPNRGGYTNAEEKMVYRGNITGIREKKFITRDIRKPSDIQKCYRYSPIPLSDPYPVYAWFDNGSHKIIDKPKN